MAIEIFWASGSPYAWRVLLLLEHKGVAYESRLLSLSKAEHKTPEYLRLSPRGRVPALCDGEVTLSESLAIMWYLERKFEQRPLFGRTPAEAGAIMRAISEYTSYVDEAVEGFILPLYFGRAEAERSALDRHAHTLRVELASLEQGLRERAYVASDALSAADLVWYPHLKSIERAAGKPAAASFEFALLPFAERYPTIAAWCARIEALPGYERTYPPHWRNP